MTQYFHPTLLGRLLYLTLTVGFGIIILLACLTLRSTGARFAADTSDVLMLIVAIIVFAATLLLGFVFLHFLRLAVSSSPSLTLHKDGIQYREIGSFDVTTVKWRDVLGTKRQGLFQHFYLTVTFRHTAKIETKKELIVWCSKKYTHSNISIPVSCP